MTKKNAATVTNVSEKKPGRRFRKRCSDNNPDVHAKIDAFMASPVPITEGNNTRTVTALECILNHLWHRMMRHSRKAEKLFWRYIRFYGAHGKSGRNPIKFLYGPEGLTLEEVQARKTSAS